MSTKRWCITFYALKNDEVKFVEKTNDWNKFIAALDCYDKTLLVF